MHCKLPAGGMRLGLGAACGNGRSGYQCACVDSMCSKLSVQMTSTLKEPEKAVSFSVEQHITATFKTDNESSETSESEFTDYEESLSDTDGEHWYSSDNDHAEVFEHLMEGAHFGLPRLYLLTQRKEPLFFFLTKILTTGGGGR